MVTVTLNASQLGENFANEDQIDVERWKELIMTRKNLVFG
jgi:hypothetical protein